MRQATKSTTRIKHFITQSDVPLAAEQVAASNASLNLAEPYCNASIGFNSLMERFDSVTETIDSMTKTIDFVTKTIDSMTKTIDSVIETIVSDTV